MYKNRCNEIGNFLRLSNADAHRGTSAVKLVVLTSVTKFGEISQLFQKPRSFYKGGGLFSVWQNFEPTLANLLCYWANFHYCKRPNTEELK